MIFLSKIHHRGEDRILVKHETPADYTLLQKWIRVVPGRLWSKTYTSWHVPYAKEVYQLLLKYFGNSLKIIEDREVQDTRENKIENTDIKKEPETEKPYLQEVEKKLSENKTKEVIVVTLLPVFIKKEERILFEGNYPGKIIQDILKMLPGARWDENIKKWHVPLNEAVYNLVRERLTGKASLHVEPLRKYLIRRNRIVNAAPAIQSPQTTAEQTILLGKISDENLMALEKMMEHLKAKAYSKNTLRTYRTEFIQFLKYCDTRKAADMRPEALKTYMVYCLETEKISENTAHSRINALKFYYEQVLNQEKFFYPIPRPKKHLQLPKVLGEREVGRLFNIVINKKHKAILFTAYSAGLRVSEVCRLRKEDVDRDRMQLFIKKGKGKKDRYVNLSPLVADVLTNYLNIVKPSPLQYVFEGEAPGNPYSSRSAQQIFRRGIQQAGIEKSLSFHSLRHSFATHLMEKGVNTKYIQEILGHFNIKTTELYLHVAKINLVNIPSPIDDIWQKGGLEI